jgi:hypothetical protein
MENMEYAHSPITALTTCCARNAKGEPCHAHPVIGSMFCYFHDPAISEEEKQNARANGGALSREPKPNLPAMEIKTPNDVILLIAESINEVRQGRMSTKSANSIGFLAEHLIKAMKEKEEREYRIPFVNTIPPF